MFGTDNTYHNMYNAYGNICIITLQLKKRQWICKEKTLRMSTVTILRLTKGQNGVNLLGQILVM